MRHRRKGKKLGRERGPRKALAVELSRALLRRGSISTTLVKAKFLRSSVERLVTLAKNPSLHHRRLLIRRLHDPRLADKLLTTIGPKYKTRPGGYLRLIRLGQRAGDRAAMARLEFVDSI